MPPDRKTSSARAATMTKAPDKAPPTPSSSPLMATVIAPKGGVGKTLLARVAIDRHRAAGLPVRIVQIDRTPQLPDLYGPDVAVVSLPGVDAQRADPLAAIVAMEPYAEAVDATLADGCTLFTDVGGGPSASAMVDYLGKARMDAHVAGRCRPLVFLQMVADPPTMLQSVELGRALEIAHPSARIVVVLNERDGKFRFFPGSAADRVWRDKVAPFLDRHGRLAMPAISAGALAPFESLGLTFTDLIEAEASDLGRRLGVSRAIAATLQGDVAEWLAEMWSRLDACLPLNLGGSDA